MDADKKRIWIRGQFVEVTDEVYRAYMQGDRKMRYFENDLKTERFVLGKEGQVVQIIPSREDSLDRLVDENARQFSDEQESVESVVLHKLEVGNMEYLTVRTMEYFTSQVKAGRIHPRVDVKELLSFISSAYTGIQTICIVNNCYSHERNPLKEYYQPKLQLKTLAQTVNYLIGED